MCPPYLKSVLYEGYSIGKK